MFDGGEVGKGLLITLRVAWTSVAVLAVGGGVFFIILGLKDPYYSFWGDFPFTFMMPFMMLCFTAFAIAYGWFGFTLKR